MHACGVCLGAFLVLCVYVVTGTFLNTLKFTVKDCDPVTGEPDDDVGYADEYVVSGDVGMYSWKWRVGEAV